MKRKKFKCEMTSVIVKLPRADSRRYGILCMVQETNKSADLAGYIQRKISKNKDLIDRIIHERESIAKKG